MLKWKAQDDDRRLIWGRSTLVRVIVKACRRKWALNKGLNVKGWRESLPSRQRGPRDQKPGLGTCSVSVTLGRSCPDWSLVIAGVRALVQGSWRGGKWLGRMGACRLLTVIQSLDFILKAGGSNGKSLSKGVELSDLQWFKKLLWLLWEEGIEMRLEKNRYKVEGAPRTLWDVMVTVVFVGVFLVGFCFPVWVFSFFFFCSFGASSIWILPTSPVRSSFILGFLGPAAFYCHWWFCVSCPCTFLLPHVGTHLSISLPVITVPQRIISRSILDGNVPFSPIPLIVEKRGKQRIGQVLVDGDPKIVALGGWWG